MPFSEVLDTVWYGNPVRAWATAALIALATLAVLLFVRRVVARRLELVAARTSTELDDIAIDLLHRTRYFFLVAVAIVAGSHALRISDGARTLVDRIGTLALLLQGALWLNRLVVAWLERWMRKRDDTAGGRTTILAAGVVVRGFLWALVVLLALRNVFGIDITALVTGLGITGIAVALAVQNILGDLFGAAAIVLDRPFEVGDAIQVDTFTGTVEHIGLKTTRLRSLSGEQIVIANSELLKAKIRNYKRQQERRVVLVTVADYETPGTALALLPERIKEIVAGKEHVRHDRTHLRGTGPAGMEYETVYFLDTPDYLVHMNIQQQILLEVHALFAELGVTYGTAPRGSARAVTASAEG